LSSEGYSLQTNRKVTEGGEHVDRDALQKNKSKDYFVKYFAPIERVKLQMPQRYLPKAEFLEWHRDMVFEKQEKMSNFAN
jgi:putative restriction endonuclease